MALTLPPVLLLCPKRPCQGSIRS